MLDEGYDLSLDFELVVNQASGAIDGYTWELRTDPVARAGYCLYYKEQATDGMLAVDMDLPDSIRAALK